MGLRASLLALAASVACTQAQYLVNELSFGYGTRISPEGQRSIPHFSIQGQPNVPELLSNKVILTPPYPGNQRSAVWADNSIDSYPNWIADVEFRANGPERAGGNFNIWLVRDGAHDVGTSSIYTVSKFEGLALVVDTSGGSGGTLRGFLNDGTKDFKNVHNIDALPFGKCDFAYRNLGRASQVKIRHSTTSMRVEVDGRLCFESDKIRMPNAGYRFGITAASAESPDSFEVFKLVVLTETDGQAINSNNQNNQNSQGNQNQQPLGGGDRAGDTGRRGFFADQKIDDPFDNEIPDEKADKYTTSKSQFADLHNRIQSLNHHLSTIFTQIATGMTVGEKRHEEVSVMLGEMKGLVTRLEKIDGLTTRLDNIEREMRSLRAEVSQKVKESEYNVKSYVGDRHETMSQHVKEHAAPGHGRLILFIIASQFVLVGAYVVYKRRKSTPKKYL